MNCLPPLALNEHPTKPPSAAERGGFDVIEFVDRIMLTAVMNAPCTLFAEAGRANVVTFFVRDTLTRVESPVGECRRTIFSGSLARFCRLLLVDEPYGGNAHRHLLLGERSVRSVTFVSNDQLSGYWLRIAISMPL